MRKTCGYLSERRGPRVPSQDLQWLPVDELGQGRGEPHNPERQGSGQGVVENVGRGGEGCSRSQRCILISAAEAAPRGRQSSTQRAARPRPLEALRDSPPMTAGQGGGAKKRETDT